MDPLPDRVSDKVDRLSGWLLCTRSSFGGNEKKTRTCRLVHWKSKAGRRDAFFCGHVGGGRARASVRARAYQVNVTAREREKEREEGRERESRALHFLKRRSRAATKKKKQPKKNKSQVWAPLKQRWSFLRAEAAAASVLLPSHVGSLGRSLQEVVERVRKCPPPLLIFPFLSPCGGKLKVPRWLSAVMLAIYLHFSPACMHFVCFQAFFWIDM